MFVNALSTCKKNKEDYIYKCLLTTEKNIRILKELVVTVNVSGDMQRQDVFLLTIKKILKEK